MADKSMAAVLVEPRKFEIREFDLPEIPPDGGLLRVERCGICGSDVHGYDRMGEGVRIMGHENLGWVAKIGAEASKRWGVKEGDRVALEEYVPCGACELCRTGYPRFCPQTSSFGHTGENPRLWYGSTPINVEPALWGGYSQYMYMHPGAMVHKVPDHVDASEAAFFLPFGNGYEWAVEYGGASIGKTVVVQGPGQQGLAAVIAAREAGASMIIVSGMGRDEHRLEIARRMGADYTVDVEAEDLVERVMHYTGGHGADVVVNVTGGGRETVKEGIDMAAFNAVVCLPAAGNETISVGGTGRKNLTMKWCHGHSYTSVERAINTIASGRYPIKEIVTHHFGLKDLTYAIDSVGGIGAAGAIHVSIDPWMET
jgi:threonine dehydrogenase-like Zn-dependent dehydrogenase